MTGHKVLVGRYEGPVRLGYAGIDAECTGAVLSVDRSMVAIGLNGDVSAVVDFAAVPGGVKLCSHGEQSARRVGRAHENRTHVGVAPCDVGERIDDVISDEINRKLRVQEIVLRHVLDRD